MVAGVSLAEIVKKRSKYEQIWARHPISEFSGVCRSLPEVSIDGESVIGVALWFRADRLPLRQQASDEIALVQCFEYANRAMSFEQQCDQVIGSAQRPGSGPGLYDIIQTIERRSPDAAIVPGCGNSGLQYKCWIGGRVGVGGYLDLAATEHDARGYRTVGCVRNLSHHSTPVLVAEPRNRSPRCCHIGHQMIGVIPLPDVGNRVLVFQTEYFARPTGRLVQRNARPKKSLVTVIEGNLVFRLQHETRRTGPPERLHVA